MLLEAVYRASALLKGLVNYGNPVHNLLHRAFQKDGEMTIIDRRTKVAVTALRRSYPMFSSTWFNRDYDVAGCPIRKNDVVVDVGANQGFFTCYAAQLGARVYAFEPHPQMYDLLMRNVQANSFAEQVVTDCTAIADFDGVADLHCSTFLGGGANTIYSEHHRATVCKHGKQSGEVRVAVKHLDSVIPKHGPIRLLKLDCEGAELAILRELNEPQRFDSMAIEFHPHAYRVEDLIRTILAFGTHQVYALREDIVHAIRTEVLIEYARSRSVGSSDMTIAA